MIGKFKNLKGIFKFSPAVPFLFIGSGFSGCYLGLETAAGLQSSDPTSGLMMMLQPVAMGLTRDQAIEAVKNGSFKLNIDTDRLNLMLGDNKWQSNLPTNNR